MEGIMFSKISLIIVMTLCVLPQAGRAQSTLSPEDVARLREQLEYSQKTAANANREARQHEAQAKEHSDQAARARAQEQEHQQIVARIDRDLAAFFSQQPRKIGVKTSPVDAQVASLWGIPPDAGVFVAKIKQGSEADQAGLKAGDIVVTLNGVHLTGPDHFTKQVKQTLAGEPLTLSIVRQGERHELTIKSTDAKPATNFSAYTTDDDLGALHKDEKYSRLLDQRAKSENEALLLAIDLGLQDAGFNSACGQKSNRHRRLCSLGRQIDDFNRRIAAIEKQHGI